MNGWVSRLVLVLASLLPSAASAQPSQRQPEEFFSGTVTEFTESQITVHRTALGAEPKTRTFTITPETRLEGRPRVKDRVTVRFEQDRAVHIIVRKQDARSG
ncbi:MAG: hypothetical protein FJW37_15725 [Acidobacteria bacterium]|nr:hypothetical protein [Acidobacteriota bacterium]